MSKRKARTIARTPAETNPPPQGRPAERRQWLRDPGCGSPASSVRQLQSPERANLEGEEEREGGRASERAHLVRHPSLQTHQGNVLVRVDHHALVLRRVFRHARQPALEHMVAIQKRLRARHPNYVSKGAHAAPLPLPSSLPPHTCSALLLIHTLYYIDNVMSHTRITKSQVQRMTFPPQ